VNRRRAVARLGLAGATLGAAAGLTQLTVGPRIPEWSGAKQAPVPLGILTVALALVAGWCAVRQQRPGLDAERRAAYALGLIGPGLLCLTTVGRLWYLPALLLLPAGLLTVEQWRATATALAADWPRVLLSTLGGCELLMAAGAAPAAMIVGAAGGIILVVAAWRPAATRAVIWWPVVLGTVPFAVLAWTAVVPLLLVVEAVAIAAVLPHRRIA
jgi:hypothetical protein